MSGRHFISVLLALIAVFVAGSYLIEKWQHATWRSAPALQANLRTLHGQFAGLHARLIGTSPAALAPARTHTAATEPEPRLSARTTDEDEADREPMTDAPSARAPRADNRTAQPGASEPGQAADDRPEADEQTARTHADVSADPDANPDAKHGATPEHSDAAADPADERSDERSATADPAAELAREQPNRDRTRPDSRPTDDVTSAEGGPPAFETPPSEQTLKHAGELAAAANEKFSEWLKDNTDLPVDGERTDTAPEAGRRTADNTPRENETRASRTEAGSGRKAGQPAGQDGAPAQDERSRLARAERETDAASRTGTGEKPAPATAAGDGAGATTDTAVANALNTREPAEPAESIDEPDEQIASRSGKPVSRPSDGASVSADEEEATATTRMTPEADESTRQPSQAGRDDAENPVDTVTTKAPDGTDVSSDGDTHPASAPRDGPPLADPVRARRSAPSLDTPVRKATTRIATLALPKRRDATARRHFRRAPPAGLPRRARRTRAKRTRIASVRQRSHRLHAIELPPAELQELTDRSRAGRATPVARRKPAARRTDGNGLSRGEAARRARYLRSVSDAGHRRMSLGVTRLPQMARQARRRAANKGRAGGDQAGPARPGVKWHRVRRGETLWDIARRYYGDGNQYHRIRHSDGSRLTNPNMIRAGQKLRLR